jgi:hypothetical protein
MLHRLSLTGQEHDGAIQIDAQVRRLHIHEGRPNQPGNFGRAGGAFFPALVGLLSSTMTLGHAIGVFSVSAYGLLVLSACRLPETKGKELSEAEHHHLFERQEISTVSRKQV